MANLINAFTPGMVVPGGVLGLAGLWILPRAQQEVNVREGVKSNFSAVEQSLNAPGGRAGGRARHKGRA